MNLSSASAANLVYINSSKVTIENVIGAVAGAKYRLSNNNFDQSLDAGDNK